MLKRFKFSILETFFGSKVISKVESVLVDLAAVLARVRGRLEQKFIAVLILELNYFFHFSFTYTTSLFSTKKLNILKQDAPSISTALKGTQLLGFSS